MTYAVLWPASEPWPECAERHCDLEGTHYGAMPLVPVAQVYQADAPAASYELGYAG
jgi:hypothetical protein